MSGVELVLLDLDETLLDHGSAARAGLLQHPDVLAYEPDPDAAFDRWHALEEEHYARYLAGELGHQEQRRARVRAYLAPLGVVHDSDAETDAWFGAYQHAAHAAWALFDDVLPCLAALGDRRIGVITNGEAAPQRAKLAALGLDHRVDPVVCSGAVGVAKPDPRIFAIACEEAGIPAHRACYVGDRLRTDAIGAARAGLRGVWLDRPGGATPVELVEAEREGVAVVRSLAALPALLAR
ncbi:HAD family hydrolase [Pseudolysinimonas sp.]|uniref:HAD family hydrolase n=1 Tax=Pseudolysinimonas sp. TaxID=2680009 RepID=UPI003F7FB74D